MVQIPPVDESGEVVSCPEPSVVGGIVVIGASVGANVVEGPI